MNNNKRKSLIIVILLIIIVSLSCVFVFRYQNKKDELPSYGSTEKFEHKNVNANINSKHQLNIISQYGDKEAYHPKVLTFEDKWNGYKYWMSYTPYPQGDDSKENPHIAVSNDLVTWTTLCNLDTPEDTQAGLRYNSDSHIVYNNKLNRLECYWRYVDDIENKAIIYRRTTVDGVNWKEKEVALLNEPRDKMDCVSPAIIFNKNQYEMWYVDKNNTIKYRNSEDGLNWSKGTKVPMNYEENVKSWHLDVIYTEKGYEMLLVAFKNWKSRNDMNLYYTVSQDGINWDTARVIMKPTVKTKNWDNKGIYRSSFIYENGVYYVFYSGTDKDYHHGIGLVYGKDIFNLKQISTDYTKNDEVELLKRRLKEYSEEKI